TPGAWLHTTLTYDHLEHIAPTKCPGRNHPDCCYTGRSWYPHEFEPHSVLEPVPDRASTKFTDVHGKITSFASQPAADYVRGEANRIGFERKPYFWRHEGSPSPWGQFSEWNKTELKHPFRWVRQFAFVKDERPDGPCYLVVADDLTGNRELEPAFNFWCLANEAKEVSPRRLRFTGQHGLDCDMIALAPNTGRIQLGEWGHTQGFLVGNPGLEEKQKLARVYGPRGGQGFLAVLYPRTSNDPEPRVESLADGKLVKLTLPDQTHWILLSKEPATVRDGPVSLSGTAAVAKLRHDGRTEVILLAEGKAECGPVTLESKTAATKQR
ncbi:MAG: hypothetical protein JNL97_10025, partial [Verrucomicrobiales bacterium]|nr:hypothetical protein [Verrucomicrobiales bacterium]